MNSLTEQKIDAILAARKPQAVAAEKVQRELNELATALLDFRSFLRSAENRLVQNLPDVGRRLEDLKMAETHISRDLEIEKERVRQLTERFSRPTLNLGVVGKAGMGKGTLLKSLTGLDDDVIPTGGGLHCTGAPSVIVNDLQGFRAVIQCHTERSFLDEVIAPFCFHFALPVPRDVKEFEALSIPDKLPEDQEERGGGDRVTDQTILKRLQDYQRNLSQYKDLLGGGDITLTDPSKVREYIAQDNESSDRVFFKWMAVRQAEVRAAYPMKDVGKIALADTPGIGDFIEGAEERLVRTVGENLDLVIFVNRPPAMCRGVGREDTKLHGLVERAIPELPLEKWSFLVVNQSDDNATGVENFLDDLKSKSIRAQDVIQLDCRNPEASRKALEKMLDYLTSEIAELDSIYLAKTQERLDSLKSRLAAFCEKMKSELPTSSAVEDFPLFQKKFRETWKDMNRGLRAYRNEAEAVRDQEDELFTTALAALFQELEKATIVPSVEDFEDSVKAEGASEAHPHALNEVRNALSQQFLPLDECLEQGFSEMRDRVRAVMTANDGGRIGRFIHADGQDWWECLTEEWKDGDSEAGVHHLIQIFSQFKLSYRGFIQHRVRKHLDHLDPDKNTSPDLKFVAGDPPDLLAQKIRMCYETAVNAIRIELEGIRTEPSMARFAILDEFVDGALRPEESMLAWQRFYEARRGDVWPDEFDELKDRADLVKSWQKAIEAIHRYSKESSLVLQ